MERAGLRVAVSRRPDLLRLPVGPVFLDDRMLPQPRSLPSGHRPRGGGRHAACPCTVRGCDHGTICDKERYHSHPCVDTEGGSLATTATAVEATSAAARTPGDLRALTVAALGVAYGDIGTSPLYT